MCFLQLEVAVNLIAPMVCENPKCPNKKISLKEKERYSLGWSSYMCSSWTAWKKNLVIRLRVSITKTRQDKYKIF